MDTDEATKLRNQIRELRYALDRQTKATNRMANNAANWRNLAETRTLADAQSVELHHACDRIIAQHNNTIAALNARLAACTCQKAAHAQR